MSNMIMPPCFRLIYGLENTVIVIPEYDID